MVVGSFQLHPVLLLLPADYQFAQSQVALVPQFSDVLLGFLVGLELVVVANDIFLFLGLLLNGGEGVLVGHDSSGGEGQLHGLVFLLPAPQVLFLFVEGHDVVHILFGGHAGVHELEHIDVVAGDGFLGVMGAVRGLEGGAG